MAPMPATEPPTRRGRRGRGFRGALCVGRRVQACGAVAALWGGGAEVRGGRPAVLQLRGPGGLRGTSARVGEAGREDGV